MKKRVMIEEEKNSEELWIHQN